MEVATTNLVLFNKNGEVILFTSCTFINLADIIILHIYATQRFFNISNGSHFQFNSHSYIVTGEILRVVIIYTIPITIHRKHYPKSYLSTFGFDIKTVTPRIVSTLIINRRILIQGNIFVILPRRLI